MGIFSRLLGGPARGHAEAKKNTAEQNRLLAQDYADARLAAANAEISRLKSKLGAEIRNGTTLAIDLAEANKKIAALTPDATAWRDRQQKAADYEKNRRQRPARAKKVAV